MKKINKNKAFTLGEVLITLTIIGVVSAITMPVLLQSVHKKTFEASIKKFYNIYSQGMTSTLRDDMASTAIESQAARNAFGENGFWHKYFAVIKDCGTVIDDCFADSYSTLNGKTSGAKISDLFNGITGAQAIVLENSMSVASAPSLANNLLVVDINGKKGPNILGYDLFVTTVAPSGDIGKDTAVDCSAKSSITNLATGCLTTVLNNNWQIKY